MEGLKVTEADLVVYVHPSKASKPLQAVRHQLSLSLFTFDGTYDGILLAYSLDVQSKTAKILPGLIPYFGVNLRAALLLFSPKPGMLVEGKVAKLGKELIHLTVLSTCSATISSKDIREEFIYNFETGVGAFESNVHMKHVIRPGSMLRFLVKSLDEELLHISGSLESVGTGCIKWLSKHATEEVQVDRSSKRNRDKVKIETNDQDHRILDEFDRSRPHKRKNVRGV